MPKLLDKLRIGCTLEFAPKETMEANPVIRKLGRRLRLGVVGGGLGSFAGEIHRAASRLDDRYEVVASVLSSNPERSRAAGRALGIAEDRAYSRFEDMLDTEAGREDGIEVLAILTPNASHYAQCRAAIDRAVDIICEKPLTTNLEQAVDLVRRVRSSGLVCCVTYNYSAYPMVRQAKAMVQAGVLGEIRMVQTEYVQGHLINWVENLWRGSWRLDPGATGAPYVVGDIASHAHHLAEYVTALKLSRLCADLAAVVPGRKFCDYSAFLLRYDNGAHGIMWATQAAAGACNGLMIRIHGEKGGLEWHQEHPNHLRFTPVGQPVQVLERGGPGLLPASRRATRIVFGHPEGYHETFANLYSDAAEVIAARRTGTEADPAVDFPTVEDGARGVRFMEAALQSGQAGGTWVDCTLKL